MEHAAEDYYDMPVDMLPSANFAGRPTSEISTSMLDGLWTMMFSSSSHSEDEADDDDDDNNNNNNDATLQLRTPPRPCDRVANCLDIGKASSNEGLGPGKALPKPPCQDNEAISSRTNHHPGSFSEKARVRQTLKQKQLTTLNIALADAESKKLATSPSSMLSTPRECYAIPSELATSETLDSPHSSRWWGRKPVQSVKTSIHPTTHSPSSARASVRGRQTLKRKDVDAADRWRVYLPGAIMLAEPRGKLRRDSVATLDPFTFDPKLESPGRRISDTVGLEGLVMFFEELGVVGKVTEVTFDQYWLGESRAVDGEMEETGPIGPWGQQSRPREGLKSRFSSASSTVSVQPPEKRKRSRLRGLLSPGRPGAGFLKSPARWGQQMESPWSS